MPKFLWLIIFVPFLVQAEIKKVSTQRAIFTATVVASACHVRVDADGVGNNRLVFGTYRKSTGADVPPRHFTLSVTETGSTLPGCSAFLAGQIATLQFGNPGQLDTGGVVTRGGGDGIRVSVQATDPQADFRGRLTAVNDRVSYPAEFAAKGLFHFRAQPVMPAGVQAGEYHGALAFVVTYQ